jgi:hypothetical protein
MAKHKWFKRTHLQGAAENPDGFQVLLCWQPLWVGVVGPASVAILFHATLVTMKQWTSQNRAFVAEAYLRNGDSVVTRQGLFRTHVNIPRHDFLPSRNTETLVQNFWESASALKIPPGRIPTERTSENFEKAWVAIVKSPKRSVRTSPFSRTIWSQRVEKLHRDHNVHPFKIPFVQELSDRSVQIAEFLPSDLSKY